MAMDTQNNGSQRRPSGISGWDETIEFVDEMKFNLQLVVDEVSNLIDLTLGMDLKSLLIVGMPSQILRWIFAVKSLGRSKVSDHINYRFCVNVID